VVGVFAIFDERNLKSIKLVPMEIELQPVPEKMKPEMVIGIQNGILHGRSPRLFSNEPFKKYIIICRTS
jgi:hypothetical protein